MEDKFKELKQAKNNVKWLLEHEAGLVDMKGLEYWSSKVETLREDIKSNL